MIKYITIDWKKLLFLIVLIFLVTDIYPQIKKYGLNKTTTSYNFQSININQWEYWVSNMGQAANIQNGSGAFWPGGGHDPNKSPIGSNGLIWIGKIDNKIVTSRSDIRFGQDPYLQAGKIFDDGTPSNPKDN